MTDQHDLSDADLIKIRRGIVALADIAGVMQRKLSMNDGIALSCKATSRLLEEFFQGNTSTSQRTALVMRSKREREAIDRLADNIGIPELQRA